MLVSKAREEKNFQDAKADYDYMKLKERNERRIKWHESKIEEEKEAIKDCIDMGFFSMAKNKIDRIEEMQNKIRILINQKGEYYD